MSERLFIITGDYSGDVHAAHVVDALKRQRPAMEIAAVGGENLRARGVTLISDQSRMGRMGAGSILGAPYHYFLGRRILDFLRGFRPDAVLLVDYGVFNLWMARQLKRMGFRVFYFIPPQVWASRRGRLRAIRAHVDHVFCIFPFEEALYQANSIPVTYVGHPLAGQLPPPPDRGAFCRAHSLDPAKPILGIFPGSRKMEVDYLLKEIAASLPLIQQVRPEIQFVLAKAASLPPDYFQRRLAEAFKEARKSAGRTRIGKRSPVPLESPLDSASPVTPSDITVLENENHAILGVSDALIAKSGTTTLEAALYGTPMTIIYKGHPLVYPIAVRMCYLPCIGLPNILTDMTDPPVPELWQDAVNPQRLAETALTLLDPDSPAACRQRDAFERIRRMFNVGDAAENVAAGILSCLDSKKWRDVAARNQSVKIPSPLEGEG